MFLSKVAKLNRLASQLRCEGGSALAIVAISFPVLIGAAGLAVDTAQWYLWKRELQFAVDQAAIAGAYARIESGTEDSFTVRAEQEYRANLGVVAEFASSPNVALVDWGSGTGNAVKVSGTAQKKLPFTSMFLDNGARISVSATARFEVGAVYPACVLAVDPEASSAVLFNGNPTVESPCGLGSLSTASDSIRISGAPGTYDMGWVVSAGGIFDQHDGFASSKIIRNVSGVEDPYEGLTPPDDPTPRSLSCSSPSAAEENNGATEIGVNVQPGTYTDFHINCDTVLDPGVYVIDGGDFNLTGSNSLIGSGVLFVLKNGAEINIGGTSTLNVSGMSKHQLIDVGVPTADAEKMEGMLIFEDSNGPGASEHKFRGTANITLSGVVYTPKTALSMMGTPKGVDRCVSLAAKTIQIGGTADLHNMCPPGKEPDTSITSAGGVRLVR